MADANGAGEATRKTDGGVLPLLLACAVVTLLGAGAATGMAWYEQGRGTARAAQTCGTEPTDAARLGDDVSAVVALPSIMTNLSGEGAPWVRLDVSVVLPVSVTGTDAMAARLAQDFLGYVRSLKADQLSGGTNLYLMKQDLREITRMRTAAAGADVLIRTLIIE